MSRSKTDFFKRTDVKMDVMWTLLTELLDYYFAEFFVSRNEAGLTREDLVSGCLPDSRD
jgi:hypothetical protein